MIEDIMLKLGWNKETITLTSLNKKDVRYFKEGFEINEDLAKELIEKVK